MNSMLRDCISFDQDLNSWDTSNVTNMSNVFVGCLQFNGDIYSWDTSSVTNMQYMLYNCDLFDQSLAAWNIESVTNFTNFMQNATGLSTTNYDATLISWAAQSVSQNESINFGGSQYSVNAAGARQSLIDDDGWTITDGGPV